MNSRITGEARSKYRHVVMAVLLTALTSGSQAAEVTGSFSGGIGATNNIARTRSNQLNDTMALVGGDVAYVEDNSNFTANVRVNANYVNYFDSEFDGEILGGASILGEYFFAEEVFSWLLQYNWGQQVFDPLRPVTPGNREDVSYLTTGPSLTLPIGRRHFFGAEVTYSLVSYEERPNDNTRGNAVVRLGRYMSPESSLSLNVSTERVEFEEAALNPDYDRNELFVRYQTDNARNSISLDAGYNEVEIGDTGPTGSGLIVRLNWIRTISQGATITLGGGTRYSDQGDIFRIRQIGSADVGETEDVLASASPFQNDFANVRYTLLKPRYSVDVFVNWNDEAYVDDPLADRRLIRAGFFLERNLTRKITGGIGYDRYSRDFTSTGREDTDTTYSLTLGYEFNPAFGASLDMQYFERGSNNAIDEFDESRVFLIFNYVPKWAR